MKIAEKLDQLFPEMILWRRFLHQHPELSYQEVNTAAFVADHLQQLGLQVQTGIGGFGGLPHETIENVLVGFQIVKRLQSIITRNFSSTTSAIISRVIHSRRKKLNIILERCSLFGKVRTFYIAIRDQIVKQMNDQSMAVCTAYCVRFKWEYK